MFERARKRERERGGVKKDGKRERKSDDEKTKKGREENGKDTSKRTQKF